MEGGFPRGLGSWGVSGVFKEAARLQSKYFSLLAPFIFAFVLPTALIHLLEVLGVAWWAAGHNPFLPPGPHNPHILGFHSVSPPTPPPTPSGRAILIMLAVSVLLWLLASLAVASFCKAVEHIYSEGGEETSVIKSIVKSLPSALFRLVVTSLWVLLLTFVTVFTVSLPFALLGLIFKRASVLGILQEVFVSVAVTVLGFLFLLSQEVAVLEPENYGLAALKRSAKLVQTKFFPALTLFAVSFVVGGLLSSVSNTLASLLAVGKLPPWAVYILAVVVAVLYVVFMVYVLLVSVVLYFSSKVKCDGEEGSLPIGNPYSPLVVPAEE